ncbi:MAG: IclR family transcriptional regulator [Pseudomonadota bacterium]|nr:IclR family transcriptional regulator [Pseudomonadota bacterium]
MKPIQHMPTIDLDPLDDEVKDRRFVTALARGLDVLRCYRPGDVSLSNLEIAKRTGLPKPTISRLTYTLTRLGYLTYSERHGTYQLGSGVLSLGYAMLSGLDIRERARSLMQELADHADATIALGGRDRMDMVYLEVCRGPGAVTLRIDVGSRLPIAPTSIGRALLAVLPEDEREFLMDHLKKRETKKDYDRLRKGIERSIDEIRQRGFCTSFGEWRSDINAAAVPVITGDRSVYALNCGGPAFKISREALENDYGPRLVKMAERISIARRL